MRARRPFILAGVAVIAAVVLVAQAQTPDLDAELDALADTAHVEHLRCLYGTSSINTVTLDFTLSLQQAFALPAGADSLAVAVRACPGVAVAMWHNHRVGWTPAIVPGGAIYREGARAEEACYLSQQDILAALHTLGPPVQIVQVKKGIRCWWTKMQIAQLAVTPMGIALYLKPIMPQQTFPPIGPPGLTPQRPSLMGRPSRLERRS